ncbi:MAG: 16S rRNA (cytosine(967)-C(5))-methyltransferase RsmB [Methylococcaceae bacterium]|nr:16S rRNA (cytosine(967)-C(5))-methyltransferase RsmB [Methylococcaceae bacterium]
MNTRWAAAQVINKVLHEGQSLTTALDESFKSIDSLQDKAFIQAMCYGVCRYYQRLDFILSLLLEKPLKAQDVKYLLLIGLYQLSFMRVKPHAAVSETVQAAKNFSWAKALINAVLRNYLRRQPELEQRVDANKIAAFCHPAWLIKTLELDWPDRAESILLENNQAPPMALRVNTAKKSREDYLQLLLDQNLAAEPSGINVSGILLHKPVSVDVLPGFKDGWVSVQDSAAQLAAELLDAKPGHRVLDVCAAPGGKTSHILELQPDLEELIAIDNDKNRMLRVRENLHRLELQATLLVADAVQPTQWWDGRSFDRILLDAPCSATGVIRRHPDIKLLRRPEDIDALVVLQKNILNAVWPMLKQGGVLVYATCSVLKRENEFQIGAFLSTHRDAEESPMRSESWGNTATHGRQILTGDNSMDGFYYARIVKR